MEAQRFWSKVRISDFGGNGCWEWLAHRGRGGYGMVWDERENYAHRLVWHLVNGPIPKGQKVLHRCDNPSCVRPQHLFLGTMKDNVQDCIQKGRFVRTQHKKLTLQQVADIQNRFASGEKCIIISKDYPQVHKHHISKVARGVSWGLNLAEMEEVR